MLENIGCCSILITLIGPFSLPFLYKLHYFLASYNPTGWPVPTQLKCATLLSNDTKTTVKIPPSSMIQSALLSELPSKSWKICGLWNPNRDFKANKITLRWAQHLTPTLVPLHLQLLHPASIPVVSQCSESRTAQTNHTGIPYLNRWRKSHHKQKVTLRKTRETSPHLMSQYAFSTILPI